MRTLYVIPAAALVAAAFGICVVKIQGQQVQIDRLRADLSALTRASDAKEAEAQRRQERGGTMKRRALSPAPAPTPSPPPKDDESVARAAPPQAPLRPEERSPGDREDVKDALEGTFLGEGSDPSWSRETERAVKEKLPLSLPEAAVVRSVECRSSMCRVEIAVQDVKAYEQFARSAFKNPDTEIWNGNAFSTSLGMDEHGRMVIVSYLAREGEDLPSVEP